MTAPRRKCATVGVKYAFIGSRWLSLKTLAPTEAATNTSPTSVADAVPTSPLEAVVHDRRETGFQGRAHRFKPWAALRDLPARKSFCLHLASRQRHHAGNCDCKPATDQNQSAHRGSHWE